MLTGQSERCFDWDFPATAGDDIKYRLHNASYIIQEAARPLRLRTIHQPDQLMPTAEYQVNLMDTPTPSVKSGRGPWKSGSRGPRGFCGEVGEHGVTRSVGGRNNCARCEAYPPAVAQRNRRWRGAVPSCRGSAGDIFPLLEKKCR